MKGLLSALALVVLLFHPAYSFSFLPKQEEAFGGSTLPNPAPRRLFAEESVKSILNDKQINNGAPDNVLIKASSSPAVPIRAACIPYTIRAVSGCLLKVLSAKAGSTVRFSLRSNRGQVFERTLQLEPNSTSGAASFWSGYGNEGLPSFNTTVEYDGEPSTRVQALDKDPDLAIDQIECYCRSYIFFEETCKLKVLYRGAIERDDIVDVVQHDPIKDEDQVDSVSKHWPGKGFLFPLMDVGKGGIKNLSVTVAIWDKNLIASGKCPSP